MKSSFDGMKTAPGWPGIEPRWTSSRKSGAGTALTSDSGVWFTISHGIINEVYYPRLDNACTRDMGMLVTDGKGFFSEEKRHTDTKLEYHSEGVPSFKLTNTCREGRYQIIKDIIADYRRDTVLQMTEFRVLKGNPSDYHLYVLLAPHISNHGSGNTGWIDDYKGDQMLFAQRDAIALALASSAPWAARTTGFAGTSDGWQDLNRNKKLTQSYEVAENGNIALTGEIDHLSCGGKFLLSLGFGRNGAEAGNRARSSLLDGFQGAIEKYIEDWKAWQAGLLPLEEEAPRERDLYRTSCTVCRTHEEKHFTGGIIAGLSIPWGVIRGDDDLGGYHLIWPRDMVETAGGMFAAGMRDTPMRVLHFLQAVQEPDGHWPQNMWLDGTYYWDKVQMDETALPILLVDLAWRDGAICEEEVERLWPMMLRAAGYIVRNGPVTQQDRWEEDPGYSPYTLATEVSALLAAADMAEHKGLGLEARYLRETADYWNDNIENWMYAKDTELSREYRVDGYYVRISLDDTDGLSTVKCKINIPNRPPGSSQFSAYQIVSPDALALVRFGLRAPDDPKILNTIKVIDGMLKVDTPKGPCWYRYDEDGYGEHEDGYPFDGTGVGRLWPLLTGERAHYELIAGNRDEAEKLMRAMEEFAGDGGLIPEQVWDREDIPEKELFFGQPTGSAMPLVWAHAEYLKLRRSLRDGRVFDLPPQPVQRYQVDKRSSAFSAWRFNHKIRKLKKGKKLRIETLSPALVHWSADGWKTVQDTQTADTGLGVYYADLPVERLDPGEQVLFTFFWSECGRWEGKDYDVYVE